VVFDGGRRTHTGSDPRQILSLLRLPVPPLRGNLYENNMQRALVKDAGVGVKRSGSIDTILSIRRKVREKRSHDVRS
jgi:hypothetical protein